MKELRSRVDSGRFLVSALPQLAPRTPAFDTVPGAKTPESGDEQERLDAEIRVVRLRASLYVGVMTRIFIESVHLENRSPSSHRLAGPAATRTSASDTNS